MNTPGLLKASEAMKAKVALLLLLSAGGPLVMVTVGAVVSTVQV